MTLNQPTATYADEEKFKKRLPAAAMAQLLSEASDDESTLSDMIGAVLFEAQGIIDSRLYAVGYATPVVEDDIDGAPAPDMVLLESHTLSIAKFLSLDRRGMSNYDPSAEKLYDSAMKWLERPVLGGAAMRTTPSPTKTVRLGSGSDTRMYGEGSDGASRLKGL